MNLIIDILKEQKGFITQKKLYELFIEKINKERAKMNLPAYHIDYRGDFHNTCFRQSITRFIHDYNANPETENIIIFNNKGIKIANEKETRAFEDKLLKSIFKRLKYARKIARKIDTDGQYDIENKLHEVFKDAND